MTILLGGNPVPLGQVGKSSAAWSVRLTTAQVPDTGEVAVPEPSALAVQYYRTGVPLWVAGTVLDLTIPALLLWTGWSARMRDAARRLGRSRWYPTVALFGVFYVLVMALLELPFGWYPQIVHFAGMARRHMALYGTTEEQLGLIAVTMRRHAALSDNALLRDQPLTLDAYLAEPCLAEPYRRHDCCLVNDGAGAFVMTSLERARDLRHPPVVVLGVGCGVSEDGEYSSLREDYLATAAVHSTPRAFAMAGLSPADVGFVTLYDNFTGMVIQQLEDLGFCRRGEGGPFVADGRIALGGSLPVNPSGGQLAQAFVLMMNNVCESVRQLRGECGARQVPNVRTSLVNGMGGMLSAAGTLVLSNDGAR